MQKDLSKNKKFLVLTDLQQKFLQFFADSSLSQHFYWTGGTALAEVYLQHRLSHDIDLFTQKDVSYQDLIDLIENFIKSEKKIQDYSTHRIHDRKLFILINKKELKVEFAKYDFPAIKKRQIWTKLPIKVDGLADIAANKAMSIIDRREPKDVLDLYYILQKKQYSLGHLLRWVKRKFGPSFDKRTLVVEMMAGVKMLDSLRPLLLADQKNKRQEINKAKNFYYNLADQYLRRILY